MARSVRSMFSPAGRFFGDVAASVRFATEASRLQATPDDVFKARGTTRQAAILDLLNKH